MTNDSRQSQPFRAWVACALAGLLYGQARLDMDHALLAWLAVACVAVGLTWWRGFAGGLVCLLTTQAVAITWGLPWLTAMNAEALPSWSPTELGFLLFAERFLWPLGFTLPIAVVHHLIRGRLPVALWLPLMWGLAESFMFGWTGVASTEWLPTQAGFRPMLLALGWLSWWPTMVLCMGACAAVGEGVATQRLRFVTPMVAFVTLLILLPPLPTAPVDVLRGFGAVHATSTVDVMGVPAPADLHVLVWPEDQFHVRPMIGAGPGRGARIDPIGPQTGAIHLLGLVTRTPGRGLRNSLVAVAPDGRVLQSRHKRLLMPIAERRLLGVGHDFVIPGQLPPTLRVAGKTIGALVCGELFSRELVAEAKAAGAALLVVAARDNVTPGPIAQQQQLGIQILRSVEFGLPSIRASFAGRASIVDTDGRILAESSAGPAGVLSWTPEGGARDVDFHGRPLRPRRSQLLGEGLATVPEADDHRDGPAVRPQATVSTDAVMPPTAVTPDTAVLFASDAPEFRTRCPAGKCRYFPVDQAPCGHGRFDTVIVAGHEISGGFLGVSRARLAEVVRCFRPRLLVLDVCFGADAPLLSALRDLDAVVVASTTEVPAAGLRYGVDFWGRGGPQLRAAAVGLATSTGLLRWQVNQAQLARAVEGVTAGETRWLRDAQLRRRMSALAVHLGTSGRVLVPVDPRRSDLRTLRRPPRPRRRTRPPRRLR